MTEGDRDEQNGGATRGGVPVGRLLALALPEWKRLAAATVFLVLGGAAGLAWPQVVRVLIDAAVAGGEETLNNAVLAMAAIFAVQGVAVAFRYYLISEAGERIDTRLRETDFSAIVEQEIGFFDPVSYTHLRAHENRSVL